MPRRLLLILPRRPRAFVDRNLHTIGYLLLFCAFLGSVYASVQVGQDNDRAINGSRVQQTRKSCHERNAERRTLRRKITKPLAATFRAQRQQTRRVPAEAFRQFEVTKHEAIRRLNKAVRGLEKAKAAFHPLDCKRRVAEVRDALD